MAFTPSRILKWNLLQVLMTNNWNICVFNQWMNVGKTSKCKCDVGWGYWEGNTFALEKVWLEETESIPVVLAGIWLYLFHLLINWTLFPPHHLFALPILKIACIILSITVIIFFLFWRCVASILQSLWRLCSLSPLLNILCCISCTSIDLWS